MSIETSCRDIKCACCRVCFVQDGGCAGCEDNVESNGGDCVNKCVMVVVGFVCACVRVCVVCV
jgi:hypothetical protein